MSRAVVCRILVVMGLVGALLPLQAQQFFTDVSADHLHARTINDAACDQLMEGYPNGSFRPEAALTQAEHILVSARILNIALKGFMVLPGTEEPTMPMDGATQGHWTQAAADFLAANGRLRTVVPQQYQPDQPVTHGEFLTALYTMITSAVATPEDAAAWFSSAALLPDGWDVLSTSVTRQETALLLERVLFYLTQHAVAEGTITSFEQDTDQNRWVHLDTSIGPARLMLPERGTIIDGGDDAALRPGARIRTLSDAVPVSPKPYYRVREVTILGAAPTQ